MRNVRETQLKKAIFMENTEFFKLVEELGIDIDDFTEDNYIEEIICYEDIYEALKKALSDYYDVDITSIHEDHFDCPGMWLVYKD